MSQAGQEKYERVTQLMREGKTAKEACDEVGWYPPAFYKMKKRKESAAIEPQRALPYIDLHHQAEPPPEEKVVVVVCKPGQLKSILENFK